MTGSAEGIAEAEHEVVLLLEIQELVAYVEVEGVGETYLQVGHLVGGAGLLGAEQVVADTEVDGEEGHYEFGTGGEADADLA